jgi:hypothetical protein
MLAGKEGTMTTGVSVRRGYLYARDDVLYSANTFHVAGRELEELLSKLPPTAGRVQPAEGLAARLPDTLGGVRLRTEAFTGPEWLQARPESSFQAELDVDLARFMRSLDRSARDLSVAWALAPDGPKVVAYRVLGVDAKELVSAYVGAVRTEIRARRIQLAGKQVTLTVRVSPLRRGYLYADGDVLYAAGSTHTRQDEFEELLSGLP